MKRFIGSARIILATVILLAAITIVGQVGRQPETASAASTTPATGNLILNPSVEQGTTSWNKGSWGSNTAAFAYKTTGHTGTHSISTTVSKYKSGDAKWYPNPVSVSPATAYTFSDWYQSNVAGTVDAVITTKSGQTNYVWLADTPASSAWKQVKVSFNTPANATKVTFYHFIGKNGTITTDDYDFELSTPGSPTTPVIPTPNPTPTPPPIVTPPPAPTAPTINITSPAANATVKGTQTITSNVSDAQGIAKVQYKLDGNDLGTVTTAPYSLSWDTTKTSNGNHTLTAIATNTANLSTTSSAVTVKVQNPTPPTVQITSPTAGATVGATQTVTVKTTDAQGMASVQYMLDGQPLGSPVTTAPYSFSWDTTKTANGSHTLTAIATDTANLSTTSASVSVNVFNQVVVPPPPTPNTGPNILPNPSVETPNPSNSALPQSWQRDGWGTNQASYSYLNNGYDGNRAVQVQISSYTSGDAKWYFTPITAQPDTQYTYSDYYESDVQTEVDAVFTMSDGSTLYQIIGQPNASPSWQKFSTDFSIPVGTVNVTVYHLIRHVGTLTTDDFSLSSYTPVGFNRPLVTLTFDDGYASTYNYGLPVLQKYGFNSTQFIITDLIGQSGYMTEAQVQALHNDSYEVASHTVTHSDMTQETVAQMDTELSQSQQTLESWIGSPVTDMAYPFGWYNATTVNETEKYYAAARGVEDALNSKDNFNPYDIRVQNVFDTTTTAQVADWVKQAQQTNTWLVLVYHSVDPSTTPFGGADWNVSPTQLDAQLAAIKSSGVTVETMQQALAEVNSQL